MYWASEAYGRYNPWTMTIYSDWALRFGQDYGPGIYLLDGWCQPIECRWTDKYGRVIPEGENQLTDVASAAHSAFSKHRGGPRISLAKQTLEAIPSRFHEGINSPDLLLRVDTWRDLLKEIEHSGIGWRLAFDDCDDPAFRWTVISQTPLSNRGLLLDFARRAIQTDSQQGVGASLWILAAIGEQRDRKEIYDLASKTMARKYQEGRDPNLIIRELVRVLAEYPDKGDGKVLISIAEVRHDALMMEELTQALYSFRRIGSERHSTQLSSILRSSIDKDGLPGESNNIVHSMLKVQYMLDCIEQQRDLNARLLELLDSTPTMDPWRNWDPEIPWILDLMSGMPTQADLSALEKTLQLMVLDPSYELFTTVPDSPGMQAVPHVIRALISVYAGTDQSSAKIDLVQLRSVLLSVYPELIQVLDRALAESN